MCPQGIVGNPVQLTVGKTTRLLLNVTRDNRSSTHTIEGWLKYGSAPVINRTISIRVNETMYSYSVQTDLQGHFVKVLGLQPVNNNSTLYVISASFDGDTARTATISAKTLEGVDYPACTTIQYNDYKPSANSTTLTIEPQATQVTQPAKTPEQIKQEAENNGNLRPPEPRFSLWFPWFRLHFMLDYDLPQGNPKIDYGWSFLPGGESCIANFTLLAEVLSEFSLEIRQDAFFSYIASFAIRTGIYLFVGANAAALAWALILYWLTALAEGLVFYLTLGSNPKAWIAAFLVQLWGLGSGFVEGIITGAGRFLTATARWILGAINHPMNAMWRMRLNFLIISGILFTISDFLIMLIYLAAYQAAF